MEFMIQREDLLKELQRLQGVVEKKNTIPILSNTFLSAGREELELMATDLELSIRTSTRAKIAKARSLRSRVKRIVSGDTDRMRTRYAAYESSVVRGVMSPLRCCSRNTGNGRNKTRASGSKPRRP